MFSYFFIITGDSHYSIIFLKSEFYTYSMSLTFESADYQLEALKLKSSAVASNVLVKLET